MAQQEINQREGHGQGRRWKLKELVNFKDIEILV